MSHVISPRYFIRFLLAPLLVLSLMFTVVPFALASDADPEPDASDLDDDNDGILDSIECSVSATDSGIDGAITAGVSFGITSNDLNDHTEPHTLDSLTIGATTYSEFIAPDGFAYTFGPSATVNQVQIAEQSVTIGNGTDGTFQADALTAFQSENLNYYLSLQATDHSDSSYDLTYDEPIIADAGTYAMITERGGNNDYTIQALDETDTPVGSVVNVVGADYVDTGARVIAFPQNMFVAILPTDDFVLAGNEIHGLRISYPGSITDGPDGKVFFIADVQPCDQDGDGITNDLDIDSDNDGISDLVEAGLDAATLDPDNNGVIDGAQFVDADNDGLADAIETLFGADTGVTPVDSDSDLLADFYDLDSDDDGIPDAVEAYPTANYDTTYANDGDLTNDDADDDGAVAIFDADDGGVGAHGGTFPDPVDTDGVGLPDYLDTDSDGDTMLDSDESGLVLAGTDNNLDGADDAVNTSYADTNGDIDDPDGDLDNEFDDTSEVGYRESFVASPEVQLTLTIASNTVTDPAVAGQDITYELLITNTGNVELGNITLDDPLLGGDITSSCVWPVTSNILAVGAVATCTPAVYSITDNNIDDGYVDNTATVNATSTAGDVSDVSDAGSELTETAGGDGTTDGDATNDPTTLALNAPDSGSSGGSTRVVRDPEPDPEPADDPETDVPPADTISQQIQKLLDTISFLEALKGIAFSAETVTGRVRLGSSNVYLSSQITKYIFHYVQNILSVRDPGSTVFHSRE